MPSIRRNLLGYLLLLLALCLGGVGVFVDRFAQAAMRAREDAETRRIEAAYLQREKEAGAKFDAELASEAQLTARDTLRNRLSTSAILGNRIDPGAAVRPSDAEILDYQRRVVGLLGGLGLVNFADPPRPPASPPPGGPTRPPGPGDGPPPRSLNPFWVNYEAPRLVARIQDALRKSLEEDVEPRHRGEIQGEFEIHLVASDPAHRARYTATARSAGLPHDLPADWDALERAARNESPNLLYDDVEVAGHGTFRRAIVRGPNPYRGPWLLALFPSTLTPPGAPRPQLRPTDLQVRVYVQFVAPAAILSDRLRQDQEDRDDQLARVRADTRIELAQLRTKLTLIGCGTFAALVVGGWLIVARGLAPVRKLSDAVSRVSEKDFRLPVRDDELSRELVPIHSRLTQTLDLLHRAFAREKQAVADISHELRTPIASLLATLDVALRKPRTPEQYRATLEDCRAIARQLGQLVERIMTLASLDAGTARTNSARIDASEVASGCAAVIRPLAAAHGLTLEVKADPPLGLDTDPDKLREVLVNLLHNAVEYNRPDGKVELNGRRANGRIVLEVRDTGIGMTPEVREKIFERFFRADPSRHATGVHAGLGLAIVKEYVGRLGGTIAVESEPGVGSTFRVELPAAPEEPEEPAPPAPLVRDARPDARSPGDPVPSGS
jgi:signal transduction histidine kinase